MSPDDLIQRPLSVVEQSYERVDRQCVVGLTMVAWKELGNTNRFK